MLNFMVAAEAVREKTKASFGPAREADLKTFRRRRRRGARSEHAPGGSGWALPRPKSAESR
jgi:hypothetical protein